MYDSTSDSKSVYSWVNVRTGKYARNCLAKENVITVLCIVMYSGIRDVTVYV